MFLAVKDTGYEGARQGTGQDRLEPGHRPVKKLGEKWAIFRKKRHLRFFDQVWPGDC